MNTQMALLHLLLPTSSTTISLSHHPPSTRIPHLIPLLVILLLSLQCASAIPFPNNDPPKLTSLPATASLPPTASPTLSPCRISGNINQPYCPHNLNNPESPLEGSIHPRGSPMRMSWNAQWNQFASQRSVDIYFCPSDNTKSCIPIAVSVSNDSEFIERVLDMVAVDTYYYIVVPAGNSPTEVPFSNRGPKFFVVPSLSSAIPQPTSVSITVPTDSVASQSTFQPLSDLAIILISSLAGLVLVILIIAIVLHQRARHKFNNTSFIAKAPDQQPKLPSYTSPSTSSSPHVSRQCTTPEVQSYVPVDFSVGSSTPVSMRSIVPTDRLVATPIGAISSTEAILIANSFKLALKHSIDDQDDDQDISTMIESLGMRPVPDDRYGVPPVPPPAESINSGTGSPHVSVLPTLTSELSMHGDTLPRNHDPAKAHGLSSLVTSPERGAQVGSDHR